MTQVSTSHQTTDHEIIMRWVEDRGGHPAMVASTKDGMSGLLRIDFPGYSGAGSLEPVSWDEFFRVFDERGLEFLYQEKTSDGDVSRFFKFVRNDTDRAKSKKGS